VGTFAIRLIPITAASLRFPSELATVMTVDAKRHANFRGARMLVIGFASGRIQAVPANLILVKNISVIGVVWGAQTERHPRG